MKKTGLRKNKTFLESYVEKSDKIYSKTIEGKTAVFFLEKQPFISNNIYVLNDTATKIWRLFNDNVTIKEIIEKIYNEFDIDYSQTQKDVTDFIITSLQKGLINIHNNKRKLIQKRKILYKRCSLRD